MQYESVTYNLQMIYNIYYIVMITHSNIYGLFLSYKIIMGSDEIACISMTNDVHKILLLKQTVMDIISSKIFSNYNTKFQQF